jgi:hypothetical protein
VRALADVIVNTIKISIPLCHIEAIPHYEGRGDSEAHVGKVVGDALHTLFEKQCADL